MANVFVKKPANLVVRAVNNHGNNKAKNASAT